MNKKFAHVENNQIKGIYDTLPTNWKNISNFYALEGNTEVLSELGWSEVQRDETPYDQATQNAIQEFRLVNGVVVETLTITDIPQIDPQVFIDNKWNEIRSERDRLMADFEWRYIRYARELRLFKTPTDLIESLDTYMQALADITNQQDPFNITWPIYNTIYAVIEDVGGASGATGIDGATGETSEV